MSRLGFGTVLAALLTWTLAVPAGEAGAQNILSVPSTAATAGAADLVIPIDLTVGTDLTVLSFDVTFQAAFCNVLVNPGGIVVRKAGRTIATPQENPIDCSSGTIRIAVFDLSGGVVIPQGSGEVFEIDVGALRADAAGMFTFTPANLSANNGPATVSIAGVAGTLTITGQPPLP